MVGDNIRRIRAARNMTQTELAENIHVKRQTISSWEINRTEPNMALIEALAVALECSKSDIIGEPTAPTSRKIKLSKAEYELLTLFRNMSNEGQAQLLSRAREMQFVPMYQKKETSSISVNE